MDESNTHPKNPIVIIVLVLLALFLTALFVTRNKQDKEEIDPNATTTRTFSLTIKNLSESQPLSPGVFIVHDGSVSIDFDGLLSPKELEPLAEYGDNTRFFKFVRDLKGVSDTLNVSAPVLPGELSKYSVSVSPRPDAFLSGIMMLVGTNDGYALVDSVPLFNEDGKPQTITISAKNYDNGTEDNNKPGSGFSGGQPDSSKGVENVENGTATVPQEIVSANIQITETVLELTITPEKKAIK